MANYRFLGSEDELKWFYDHCVFEPKRDEVYYLSLSARNKAFSEEERVKYLIGRSEMFAKTVIRNMSFDHLLEIVKRMGCDEGGFLTKARVPYPAKCLVMYFNFNPASTMKVLMEARKKLDDINDELTFSLLKNSEDGIKEAFHKMNKMHDTILSLYARNEGTKYWIDFDIDCADEFMTKAVIDNIHNLLISAFEKKNFVMVRTPGGIHILVKKESIKKDPKILCEKIITILPQAIEVVRNINAMIPLPGTFAREKLVYILNKKDFD